jgi:hypothetical protein
VVSESVESFIVHVISESVESFIVHVVSESVKYFVSPFGFRVSKSRLQRLGFWFGLVFRLLVFRTLKTISRMF